MTGSRARSVALGATVGLLGAAVVLGTTLHSVRRGEPLALLDPVIFAMIALWGVRSVMGPHADRHGFSRQRRTRYATGFSILLVGSIVALGVGYQFRPIDIREVPVRAQPLVDAILAYERANGEPPGSLRHLAPDYIDAVPATGLGFDRDFGYRRIRNERQLTYAWYRAGNRNGVRPESCVLGDGDVEEALLVLAVDGDDRIAGSFADRVPAGEQHVPFEPAAWRVHPEARAAMVRSASDRYDTCGMTVADITDEIGAPDGRGQLRPRRWELRATETNWSRTESATIRYLPTGQYRPCSDRYEVELVGEWVLERDRVGDTNDRDANTADGADATR